MFIKCSIWVVFLTIITSDYRKKYKNVLFLIATDNPRWTKRYIKARTKGKNLVQRRNRILFVGFV